MTDQEAHLVFQEPELKVIQEVISQIEKQIDVVKAFYHSDDEVVYQEIALYKLPTIALASGGDAERIVRAHHARILTIESEFTILEKTGSFWIALPVAMVAGAVFSAFIEYFFLLRILVQNPIKPKLEVSS